MEPEVEACVRAMSSTNDSLNDASTIPSLSQSSLAHVPINDEGKVESCFNHTKKLCSLEPEPFSRQAVSDRDGCVYKWTEVNGKKHGPIKIYENDRVIRQLSFVNNLPHGTDQAWYNNRNLKHRTRWWHGKKYGLEELWHENGNYKSKTNYQNGQVCATETMNERGILIQRCKFALGKKHGKAAEWYDDGTPKRVTYYHRGAIVGDVKAWLLKKV
jgi:hypothetical protein